MPLTLRAFAGLAAVLMLITVACGGARKDTGLPASPTPLPEPTEGVVRALASSVFEPKDITIKVGKTVTWNFVSILHNAQADDGSFNSHPDCASTAQDKCSQVGQEFTFTFKTAGTFPYFCVIHGTKGGVGMAGKVIVEA